MSILNHMKILVVDDTTTSRMLVIEALREIGFQNIAIARDGSEALKSMMSSPAHLIISDFEMPGLNGLDLLKGVRSYAPTRHTPFIMVTGRGDRSVIERGRQLGLNNYVAKPFTTATLKSSLQAVVKGL
ncbi:MAG: response regulator [Hyphomicrobiales bacterium]|nr:response regulator [Hyphomicrobiales bacterium]